MWTNTLVSTSEDSVAIECVTCSAINGQQIEVEILGGLIGAKRRYAIQNAIHVGLGLDIDKVRMINIFPNSVQELEVLFALTLQDDLNIASFAEVAEKNEIRFEIEACRR